MNFIISSSYIYILFCSNIYKYIYRTSGFSRCLKGLLRKVLVRAPSIILTIFFRRTKTFPLLKELHKVIIKFLEKRNRSPL